MDSYLAALGAVLTAIFTGVTMWYNLKQNAVRIITLPDGGFTVHNPKSHSVVIRDIVAGKGTLRSGKMLNNGLPEWGDHGETRVRYNVSIAPEEEKLFSEGMYFEGRQYTVTGKTRRVHFLQESMVDVVLFPLEPLTGKEE